MPIATELDEELELEFEDDDFEDDSEFEVTEFEEELEENEEQDSGSRNSNPRRQQPTNRVAELEAELKSKDEKIADLNKRLGDSIRVSGEKLKALTAEQDAWIAQIHNWQQTVVNEAFNAGIAEGVKKVEDRLLPKLLTEEKTAYYEDVRHRPIVSESSPRPVQPLDLTRKTSVSDTSDQIHMLVQQFTAQGVPVDQLEQTSAEAVVQSAAKYFRELAMSAKDDKIAELESKVERQRESSGAIRVSSGNAGGATRTNRSAAEKRIKDIDAELKRLRGRGTASMGQATSLLREKERLQRSLAAARRAS